MATNKVSIPLFCNSLTANQPAGDFTLTIPNGIQIPRDAGYKLYLHNLGIWNTSPNIYATNAATGVVGNNTLSVTCVPNAGGAAITVNITFPTGGYGVQDICNYVNQRLAFKGINTTGLVNGAVATNYVYLSPFLTIGTIININGADSLVDFTQSPGLANMLGFTQNANYIYTVADAVDDQIISASSANITTLNSFNVHISNIIDESMAFTNIGAGALNYGGYIYSNLFTTPFGSLQSETIQNPIGVPLNPGVINQIRIKIVDQNGNTIHFNQNSDYQNNGSVVNLVIKNY